MVQGTSLLEGISACDSAHVGLSKQQTEALNPTVGGKRKASTSRGEIFHTPVGPSNFPIEQFVPPQTKVLFQFICIGEICFDIF
jgi:hypothetical protein